MKRAVVLGITGQDGSYMAEILLDKGYIVHGMVRRSSVDNLVRIRHLLENERLHLHTGDLLDASSLVNLLRLKPDEVYNLADQDDVRESFKTPLYNYRVTFEAVGTLFELALIHCPEAMIFQPVSATMFAGSTSLRMYEKSTLCPDSPYAIAKTGAFHLVNYYRDRLRILCGIMFNHDSPRRSDKYLIHRICRHALEVSMGDRDRMFLYNKDQLVDVGYAPEYMEAVWKLMDLEASEDFVIATGKGLTVGDLGLRALELVGQYPHKLVCVEGDWHKTLIGDITKTKRTIDFNPSDALETLEKILQGVGAMV